MRVSAFLIAIFVVAASASFRVAKCPSSASKDFISAFQWDGQILRSTEDSTLCVTLLDTTLSLQPCNTVEPQQWSQLTNFLKSEGLCLEVLPNDLVQMTECHFGKAQQFVMTGNGHIKHSSGRCLIYAVPQQYDTSTLFPFPQKVTVAGKPRGLAPNFFIIPSINSPTLLDAILRYQTLIKAIAKPGDNNIMSLKISVSSGSEYLGASTDYSYSLTVNQNVASIQAETIYGAMYGMESFAQLVVDGLFSFTTVEITDAPNFNYRGLMIDTGRRFVPMDLCKQIMDGMAATKMNVLHFHASDYGAFRIQTKKYPQLTDGLNGQFYKQSDIKELVAYAKNRGIRIIPEFDIPGHSSGFAPLAEAGMKFCSENQKQLFDDPKNQTYSMLIDIFSEMIPLFPDEVFHLGCDETGVVGPCTLDKTRVLEEKLFRFLQSEDKMPMGWDEIYFTTKSAINGTVIELWHSDAAGKTTSDGFYSVDANDGQLYLDSPSSCTIPNTKKNCMWLDIAPDFTPEQLKFMYGGETAMWCDHYVGTGDVAWMSEVKYTKVFEESFSSCIWPRGAAAGASFWNYREDLTTEDEEFLRRYDAHNARLSSRGITTCPDKCVCTQEARCGKKYVK